MQEKALGAKRIPLDHPDFAVCHKMNHQVV